VKVPGTAPSNLLNPPGMKPHPLSISPIVIPPQRPPGNQLSPALPIARTMLKTQSRPPNHTCPTETVGQAQHSITQDERQPIDLPTNITQKGKRPRRRIIPSELSLAATEDLIDPSPYTENSRSQSLNRGEHTLSHPDKGVLSDHHVNPTDCQK